MSTPSGKVKEEFVALHVVALVRALMVEGTGLEVVSSSQIALGALILGKAVLIAHLLPAVNRFPDKPLAYNVGWKSAIYFLLASPIHYLERVADSWKEAGGFAAANQTLLAEIVWPHFWSIQIVVLVLIVNWCVKHEVIRVIGPAPDAARSSAARREPEPVPSPVQNPAPRRRPRGQSRCRVRGDTRVLA